MEHTLSSSLVAIRILRGEESRQRGSAICEKRVFSCVGSEKKWPINTDGTARGFQYDEGETGLVSVFEYDDC